MSSPGVRHETGADAQHAVRIGAFSFTEYCAQVERFHGSAAPGVVIGGFMVDLARSRLPEGVLFEAICETRVCLADAIQLLTPCTTGNGRLKVIHVGRFALSLYDKYSGDGIRTFLEVGKLRNWPEVRAWFLKEKAKQEQDGERLLAEIRDAGTAILGVQRVQMSQPALGKKKIGAVGLCPRCGEAYPTSAREMCGGCRGELPYRPTRE